MDSTPSNLNWRPGADVDTLKSRARLLEQIRRFFADRSVLEVDTPILSQAGSTEAHLEHFTAMEPGVSGASDRAQHYFLNTSAELAMKRLLAADSGDIYQISKVFRAFERGTRHHPEFTMLEWYRLGFDLNALMDEVEQLLVTVAGSRLTHARVIKTYSQVFNDAVQLDPLSASVEQLQNCFKQHSSNDVLTLDDKQAWLDLIMSHVIEPGFNPDQLTFVTHYPAEQASLARLSKSNPEVAERFEVFAGGLELANGFHELCDVGQQRQRMQTENNLRQQQRKSELKLDERFLAALEQGLPDCSGVAIGFDRVCMWGLGKQKIDEVMSFTIETC